MRNHYDTEAISGRSPNYSFLPILILFLKRKREEIGVLRIKNSMSRVVDNVSVECKGLYITYGALLSDMGTVKG
ncbi:unnamed protein product [Leptosia nina]|uniref:Uncharacterized protein n=1 Tax=Leptosia nina TaxID=320188 RepID=A0AAV1K6W1_9NEOP